MNEAHEFKQRVLEEQLFNKLKDTTVMNSNDMRKEYKNINVTRLRTRIINYQIDTYGSALDIGREYHTKEENLKKAIRDRVRRYERRTYEPRGRKK